MKYFISMIFFLFLFSCSDFDVKKINCKDDGDCPNTHTCNIKDYKCYECDECGLNYSCTYRYGYKQTWCCNDEDFSLCYVPCETGEIYSNVLNTCVITCTDKEEEDKANPLMCKCKEAYIGIDCSECNTEAGYISDGDNCVPDCNLIKGGNGAILQDGECVCESEGYTLYTDEQDVKRCVPTCNGNLCDDNRRHCENNLCICNPGFEYNQNAECVPSCNPGECEPNGVCEFVNNAKHCVCSEGYFTPMNNPLSCIECDELNPCESGKICVDDVCKDKGDCGLNAYQNDNGDCVCIGGYHIMPDNINCTADCLDSDCENGTCELNPVTTVKECECSIGYITDDNTQCKMNCSYIDYTEETAGVCNCRNGYIPSEGNTLEVGETCVPFCNSIPNSHPNESVTECLCDDGYEAVDINGNGVVEENELCSVIPNVSVGANHICALFVNGEVSCAGNNNKGQLGNNSIGTVYSSTFQKVKDINGTIVTNIKQLVSGNDFNCILLKNDTAKCWGNIWESSVNYAKDISGLTGIKKLSAGSNFVCALLSNGVVKCWGENQSGQFGNGTTTKSWIPTSASSSVVGKDISTGKDFTCVLLNDNNVSCFGNDMLGQLGDNQTHTENYSLSPVIVNDLLTGISNATVKSVYSGSEFSCALIGNETDNILKCWGNNHFNQFTIQTAPQPNYDFAKEIPNLTNISNLFLGNHILCVNKDDTIKCSGNYFGNTLVSTNIIPSNIKNLSIGKHTFDSDQFCYVDNELKVNCFGKMKIPYPISINNMDTAKDISITKTSFIPNRPIENSICTVDINNMINCLGTNDYGQFGQVAAKGITSLFPVNITLNNSLLNIPGNKVVAIGNSHLCVMINSNKVLCAGDNREAQLGNNINPNPQNPLTLESNEFTNVIIEKDATTTEEINYIKQISSGNFHTCALLDDGANNSFYDEEVVCWGLNDKYQLVRDATLLPKSSKGVYILSAGSNHLKNVKSIVSGSNFNCAVINNGTSIINQVYCWGDNSFGQLGQGNTNSLIYPVSVFKSAGSGNELDNIVQITAGEKHICAIDNTGKIYCWGNNQFGQLGTGNTNSDYYAKEITTNISETLLNTKISAGGNHTCIATNQKAFCFGNNDFGQLGTNNNQSSSLPVIVVDKNNNEVTNIKDIKTGVNTTCIIFEDNKYKCFGDVYNSIPITYPQ